MKYYKKEYIRRLRNAFQELQGYLDDEIEHCFSLYCEIFHATSWTKVVDEEFIKWAIQSPLESIRHNVKDLKKESADRIEVLEREHADFFENWHRERRKREKLIFEVERCYGILLSESNTKAALFKSENILREALEEQKIVIELK